jgi:hypothetical protein
MPTINNNIYIGKISSHLKFPPFTSWGQWFYLFLYAQEDEICQDF